MQSASRCEDLFGIMHGIMKFVPDIRKAENWLCLIFQLHSGEFSETVCLYKYSYLAPFERQKGS